MIGLRENEVPQHVNSSCVTEAGGRLPKVLRVESGDTQTVENRRYERRRSALRRQTTTLAFYGEAQHGCRRARNTMDKHEAESCGRVAEAQRA